MGARVTTNQNRPVVFLHGLGGSAERTWRHNGWLDLVEDAGRPAIGIDLLGHGTAPRPHEPEAYAAMADHVLNQLPAEPVDAIGFSLGSRTLLECAIKAPDRFARLVVTGVGANLFERDHERHAQIAAAIRGEADPSDPFSRYFTDLTADPDADPAALAALLEAPGEVLTAERLAPVTMPVLVVLGDNDFAGPADPLLAALPQAEFVELANTDHFATPRSMKCMDAALVYLDAAPF